MTGRNLTTGIAALIGIVCLCCALPALGQDQAPDKASDPARAADEATDQAQAAGWEMRVCADPSNMPYSNRAKEGFENRIAEILADELNAELSYVWFPRRRNFIQYTLRAGRCDMVLGTVDGSSQMLTTLPYYRSSYVFVFPKNADYEITTFDDPELKDLTIGVPLGGQGAMPPNMALANQGLSGNLKGYPVAGLSRDEKPGVPIISAVAEGEVDVAVAWGPIAGYYAQKQDVPLQVVPVSPKFIPPYMPMVYSISIGLRQGDRRFARLLNRAVVKRWEDIQAVLKKYNVPLLDLPKPKLTLKQEQ